MSCPVTSRRTVPQNRRTTSRTGDDSMPSTLKTSPASFGSRLQHKGVVMLVALALWGVLMIAFAATTDLLWALVTLVGIGACQMAFMANNNTILQMTVPNELRGRVMSLYMLVQGITPAGALFAGAMTAAFGAPTTVMVMGVLCSGLGLLAGWRTPLLRQWTEHQAVAAP